MLSEEEREVFPFLFFFGGDEVVVESNLDVIVYTFWENGTVDEGCKNELGRWRE